MFSFSSALWLAAASAMITAEVSAAYNPDSTCEVYGSKLKCARQVCCEPSKCKLRCDAGELIHMYRADFGRKDTTTCSARQDSSTLKNVRCTSAGATSIMASRCNGRNWCDVMAATTVFGDPCSNTDKYLEVYYFCRPLNVVCEEKEANIRCGDGEVIRFHSAQYKRGKRSRCSGLRTPYLSPLIECTSPPSTDQVAKMCNDKNNCVISADSPVFKDPCADVPKTMSLSYFCL